MAKKKPVAKKSAGKKPAATKAIAKKKMAKKPMANRPPLKKNADGVVLLSGENPQIAMADGDAPVKAYLAAIPGWKRGQSEKLDALIVKTVPGVQKAVKWNSPMYSLPGQGFFVSFHMFGRYIKVTFFRGSQIKPPPPVTSKVEGTRYAHIEEHGFDEAQMAAWIEQAAALPGWLASQT